MNTPNSTSPTPQSSSSTAHTQAHHAAGRGQGRPASGSDVFANLLSLLSTGSDFAADALTSPTDNRPESLPADGSDPAQTAAQDGTQNPLAALLGWAGAPMPQMPADATGGLGRQATGDRTSLATGAAADLSPTHGATSEPRGLAPGHSLPTPAASEAASQPLDAAALAVPARADAAPATSTTNDRLRGPASVRVTAWRSTTGLALHPSVAGGGASSLGPSALSTLAPSTFAQVALSRTGAQGGALAPTGQGRSTASLDERVGQPGSDPLDAVVTNAGRTVQGRSEMTPYNTDVAGPAGAGGASDTSTDLAQGSTASGDDGQTGDAAMQTPEPDEPASVWSAQTLRHASVHVGEPGDQALEIQLSMAGQEVSVAFRTDDAQTRASLAADAGATLGELLQRSGIDLGEVSVGTQGQQAGHDLPNRKPQGTWASAPQRGGAAESPAADASAGPTPPRPRADGSHPLDLFV